MKIEKKVIASLNKCYATTLLPFKGEVHFLAAAEKEDPCYLFDEEGNHVDTVWTGPGGVMTMTPVPGREGQFLSTCLFYSPDNADKARIVVVTPRGKGDWEMRTLCHVPFVHRFGILGRGGIRYLLVCCVKSGMEYKGDWRYPGACYGAVLPEDLSVFDDNHTLPLKKVKDGMLKNHGYCKIRRGDHDAAVVACEEGTFMVEPPAASGEEWEFTRLSGVPSSDSVLLDFDGDGKPELGMISPFHGNSLTIWHLDEEGNYVPQWKYSRPETETEFLHATWTCDILGRPTWIVGWRKGTRDTILISWDEKAHDYHVDFLDHDAGCANAMHFVNKRGQDVVIGMNRESDEVALYTITG